MNGVSDRLQIDETSRTACRKKKKTEELADIYCMLYFWKDSLISALTVTISKSTS